MKHLQISVAGIVQGVYFRDTTKQKALELGISGFARNETNGTVYIEAEGGDEALDALVAWCHEGSPKAVVELVEVSEQPAVGHTGFKVL